MDRNYPQAGDPVFTRTCTNAMRRTAPRLTVNAGGGALAVLAAVALISACEQMAPTVTTSTGTQVPAVAGTYTGTYVGTYPSLGIVLRGEMTMKVTQSGENVTVAGSMTFDNVTLGIPAMSGFIDGTGLMTVTENSLLPGAEESRDCGTLTSTGGSITFSDGTMEIAAHGTSDYCGDITFHASLTK